MTTRESGRADFAHIESRAAARTSMYQPTRERIAGSQMTAFTRALQAYTGERFADEQALHDFSVREFRVFWNFLVHWALGPNGYTGDRQPVCEGDDVEHATFFPRLRLNYARCLLATDLAGPGAPALTACHADGRRLRWTRAELRDQVGRLAKALSGMGLREGDRVAGVMRNDGAAVIAALAVAAVGATLSTAAPEMGVDAVLDRFGPLAPRLLLAHVAPRDFDTGQPLADKVAQLASGLRSLRDIVCLDEGRLPASAGLRVHGMAELIAQGGATAFEWRSFPFNHPLFIMFSSGTTGRPKCIVHGAGGSLLEHVKEQRLHTDLRRGDRLYFHTGCGWMMWNWQLSALASGVEIVTFDGPISTVDRLWRLVADEHITVFGTSPAYLAMCEEAGLVPGRQQDLGALRAILSTGSVLHDRQFHWVRGQVKNVPLQSISGGTDILGCFVLGHPSLPVHAGEAQCKSLGLDVQAWRDGGPTEGIGDLVCAKPFPSRPLGFFGDTDGAAFHAAYFARNPGVWTHGDLIQFAPDGGARLHGRTDGVLNVRGIKIAPEEILRVLRGMSAIREAMVVEQPGPDPRVVLLLVLRQHASLDAELVGHLRGELAHRLSAAHVPDLVVAVDELPVTHSGKLSEAAARAALGDAPVGNAGALRNPACLDEIRRQVAQRDEQARRPTATTGATPQQMLQALWQEKFGFAPIAPDDNFFELGGNSLLAARVLADLKRLTGRELPLSTLLVAPTVREMAALLEGEALPPAPTGPVSIRAGLGAPVFLVHGLSGSVMECWRLAHALRTPRPV
jgi:acetoacetyl-CoA synthetase